MSTLIHPDALRKLLFGSHVVRAAAALPQSTTGHLFTVTGGRILIIGLVGKVTTAVQAQATTLQLVATPGTGTAVNLNLVTASDLNAKEVGSQVTLDVPANKAVITTAGAGYMGPPVPISMGPGTIDLTTVASSTGAMQWDLFYVELDDGASVAAA